MSRKLKPLGAVLYRIVIGDDWQREGWCTESETVRAQWQRDAMALRREILKRESARLAAKIRKLQKPVR